MPTPLEVLLDPVSLYIIGIYAILMIWEFAFPARKLPHVRFWKIKGILVFFGPKNYIEETGFYIGASQRIGDMLMFKDISKEKKPSKSEMQFEEVF